LPQGWIERAPTRVGGADVYVAPDGSLQLAVSSFGSSALEKEEDRQKVLNRLLDRRLEVERSNLGTTMTAGEPRRSREGNVLSARYEGTYGRWGQFATLVMVSPSGAWCFFLEAPDARGYGFRKQADAIFASIDVEGAAR
jgi:hypothetical protein